MNRQSPSSIRRLFDQHGFSPRKAYGQHFLADSNLVDKVVSLAEVEPGDAVVEVGAGTGVLTAALAAAGAEVIAYEVDLRLRPILAETLAGIDADLRFVDVMDVDLAAELGSGTWKLVANLPYNIGTPLLLDVLIGVESVTTCVVMVQAEVADRLAAAPGDDAYGLPSVVVGLTTEVTDSFGVPPQVFVPPPAVESTVLRFDRIDAPAELTQAVTLAREAFGQRRKMLRRSLSGVTADQFDAAGIAPTSRPEELSPHHFVALARAVAA